MDNRPIVLDEKDGSIIVDYTDIHWKAITDGRIINIVGEINPLSAQYMITLPIITIGGQIISLKNRKEDSGYPITLLINSQGGCAYTSFSIASIIDDLVNQEVEINAMVTGACCSGAAFILAACSHRVCHSSSLMTFHNVQAYIAGSMHNISKQMKDLKDMENVIKNILANRTKLTKKQITEILTQDVQYTASQALKAGIVDEIIGVFRKRK